MVFRFIWAGRTEFVRRGVMCRPLETDGRGVPRAFLKALCLHVAFQARLVAGAFTHKMEPSLGFGWAFPCGLFSP